MMRARKLQQEELLLDLGNYLPAGRRFWWASEVDEIVGSLKDHLGGSIRSISHQSHLRSDVRYQVLHIAVRGGRPEKEFRSQVSVVMRHYKHRLRLLPRVAS